MRENIQHSTLNIQHSSFPRGRCQPHPIPANLATFATQAYRNLILLYTAEGKNGEATRLIFSLEKKAPTPPSYLAIAETLKIIGDVNGARFWAARGLNKFPADRQLRALLRG